MEFKATRKKTDELYHHGVSGMKWGVHNMETKFKYGEISKSPAAIAAAGGMVNDEEAKKLKALLESGQITQAEYKARMLEKLGKGGINVSAAQGKETGNNVLDRVINRVKEKAADAPEVKQNTREMSEGAKRDIQALIEKRKQAAEEEAEKERQKAEKEAAKASKGSSKGGSSKGGSSKGGSSKGGSSKGGSSKKTSNAQVKYADRKSNYRADTSYWQKHKVEAKKEEPSHGSRTVAKSSGSGKSANSKSKTRHEVRRSSGGASSQNTAAREKVYKAMPGHSSRDSLDVALNESYGRRRLFKK